MYVRSRVQLSRGSHKGLDKVIIGLAPDATLPQTKIQIIGQKLLVVGAAVEDDGQAAVRVDAGAQRSEGELGDGYENAADALVTDAKNLLPI